jgi:GTP-binding protein LepA
VDRRPRTRNFAIIAHIDHGKSTLADRLLQRTGAVADRDMKAQLLDSMDIERERGITIKAQTASLPYKAKDGTDLHAQPDRHPGARRLHLRGLPLARRLRGALLVVDATQGVEAQTLANVYLALEANLEIIPVINKIDLPSAGRRQRRQADRRRHRLDASDAVLASRPRRASGSTSARGDRRAGPAAAGGPEAPPRALIIDSWFDTYVGVVILVRVFDGRTSRWATGSS